MKNTQKQLYKFFSASAILLVAFFASQKAMAQTATSSLIYRGVDLMKFTKDVVMNQPTDAAIQNIVTTVNASINPTHLSIAVPLDASSAYATAPAPRTAEAFTQKWTDAIHSSGKKVIFRGTWNGIEGTYSFQKLVGANRIPAGTKLSAATDGNSTWLGKTYKYIIDHPQLFADGDVWAVLPERTENIFSDSTSFLPHSGAGIQANYAAFFNDLKLVSDQAFAAIGKKVVTGLTANNYTEVASTWLPQSVFDTAGMTVVDHYGSTHTPQEMESDLRKIYTMRGKPVFLQEWGDYWNSSLSLDQRKAYLDSMFAVWQKLANEKILAGYNYWGAWDNNLEGILTKTAADTYKVNERGMVVASFYKANSVQTATVNPPPPPPAPAPSPSPTPSPSPSPAPTKSKGKSTRKDGSLVKDSGTIYAIENGLKRPVSSMEVFAAQGYSLSNVVSEDSSQTMDGAPITDPNARHVRGTLVNHGGTIYFMGNELRYPFPSKKVFLSWGSSFKDIVPANVADLLVPVGPVVGEGQVLGTSTTSQPSMPAGSVVKTSQSPTVYQVKQDGTLHPFATKQEFWAAGYDFIQVRIISQAELDSYALR